MKRVLIAVLALGLLGCQKADNAAKTESSGAAGVAQAQAASGPKISREPALNAAPLGVEIGYADLSSVKQKLGGQTHLQADTNERSGGAMLVSDGQGLGVDGMSKFAAIFDKNETLVAVVMTLPKDVNGVYAKLAEKYHPVEKRIDEFMGNGTAKLEKGDSIVMIEAPHLSFTMDVIYATKTFMADAQRKSNEEQAKKEQEQGNKL